MEENEHIPTEISEEAQEPILHLLPVKSKHA
jgi:hypothetical protein